MGQFSKDFVLYVLTETSSTPDVLFKRLKRTNILTFCQNTNILSKIKK